MSEHDMLVWGPAAEGEKTSQGERLELPGWVWTCSCGASGIGHSSENEAEERADVHLAQVGAA